MRLIPDLFASLLMLRGTAHCQVQEDAAGILGEDAAAVTVSAQIGP